MENFETYYYVMEKMPECTEINKNRKEFVVNAAMLNDIKFEFKVINNKFVGIAEVAPNYSEEHFERMFLEIEKLLCDFFGDFEVVLDESDIGEELTVLQEALKAAVERMGEYVPKSAPKTILDIPKKIWKSKKKILIAKLKEVTGFDFTIKRIDDNHIAIYNELIVYNYRLSNGEMFLCQQVPNRTLNLNAITRLTCEVEDWIYSEIDNFWDDVDDFGLAKID